jgi:murein DD-endopeptidase MepM/ murein hydrolase activator NlpD
MPPGVEARPALSDNPAMNRRRFMIAVCVLVGFLPAAGCGWVEWPPPSRPQAVRTPPPNPAQPGGGDAVFVGADAVVAGKGDTVYGLSRRHRVSMRAIIVANGLTPPYHLKVGQRVALPRGPEHRVVKGDTLIGLARRYDVDFYAFARANGLTPPYTIRLGESLRIPSTAPPPAVAVAAVAPPAPAKPAPTVTAQPLPAPTVAVPKRPKPPAAIPPPPPRLGKGFVWPVRGKVISAFGSKAQGLHNDGINIAAPRGSQVRATESGVVAYAGNELRGFGKLLLIKHRGGWISAYAHNGTLLVERGGKVSKGQPVATVGSSGNVRTPQLHFELRKGKRAVDPRKHLRKGSV